MGTPAENFLSEIDSFLKRKEMSASAFGRAALNDPNFKFSPDTEQKLKEADEACERYRERCEENVRLQDGDLGLMIY